mmetsp:Transcript_24424/g.55043  ORF Transcript_24424/g.55043 Transcript_24424/m.55043 type:complete len:219 (+) Transcript_24424:1462-2118(+)
MMQAQLGPKGSNTRQPLRKNASTTLQGAVAARRNQQTKQRVANTAQARKNKIASNRGLANNQNNTVRRNINQRQQQPFVFRGNNKGYNNFRSNQQTRGGSNARGGMRVIVVNNRGNRRGQQRVQQPTRMQQQVQQQRQRVQQGRNNVINQRRGFQQQQQQQQQQQNFRNNQMYNRGYNRGGARGRGRGGGGRGGARGGRGGGGGGRGGGGGVVRVVRR